MKNLRNFYVGGKKVLLRVSIGVPLDKDGNVINDFRIEKIVPTVQYLIDKKAKVILISKRGHSENLSLKPLLPVLEKHLGQKVAFSPDCVGSIAKNHIALMKPGDILLLENVRFHPEEMKNNSQFAQKLAALGDIFVNDAFADSHREHASIVGIPKYLPSAVGFLMEKEVRVLSKITVKPWSPLTIIIGGMKVGSKTRFMEDFLKKTNDLLLGGEIANAILRAKGISISRPKVSHPEDEEIGDFPLTNPKLHLPVDVIVSPDTTGENYVRETGPAAVKSNEMVLDIGPETITFFGEIIKNSKMIIWSGPLGFFEKKPFERGTMVIADKIARNHQAFKIAGGGDTVTALKKFNVFDSFDFVSTGGGAMLNLLAGKKMPGIEALE